MRTGPRSVSFALEAHHIAKSIARTALHSRYISQLTIDVIKEYEKFNAAHAEYMADKV